MYEKLSLAIKDLRNLIDERNSLTRWIAAYGGGSTLTLKQIAERRDLLLQQKETDAKIEIIKQRIRDMKEGE